MAEGYSAIGYGRMLADRVRMDAYAAALRAAVKPGGVVLDIGTGTGMFALLAAKLGARRAYGVDPADAIGVARELARANGVADRVEFVQALSTEVDLPEPADVVVFDMRGVLPLQHASLAAVRDARERLLAPGGVLIPRRDTLLAAPVSCADTWLDCAGPARVEGIDYTPARRVALNLWTRRSFGRDQLVAGPRELLEIDYHTCGDPDVAGEAEWTVPAPAEAHGLAVWFRAELAEGIGFESGPGGTSIYQSGYFPWPEPVALAAGDRVRLRLEAREVSGEYAWRWDSEVARGEVVVHAYRQSTLAGNPPALDRLRRRAHTFVPRLSAEGRVDAYVLARLGDSVALGEIARELLERFPGRFDRWETALGRVGTLSEQYAE